MRVLPRECSFFLSPRWGLEGGYATFKSGEVVVPMPVAVEDRSKRRVFRFCLPFLIGGKLYYRFTSFDESPEEWFDDWIQQRTHAY